MKSFFIILMTVLLISCNKVQSSSLTIDVVVDIENGASSKAIITGDNFVSGNTFGLFVYYAETEGEVMQDFHSYGSMYSNIKATKDVGKWNYSLNGSSSLYEGFFLIEPSVEGKSALAICAYAPYITGSADITKIPFTIGGQYSKITDLMWAEQNYNSDNLYIEPEGHKETVYLTFKHALAMINLGFKCDHPNTTMRITSIKIKKVGQTELYASGEFDAVNLEFTSCTKTDEVLFDCTNERNGVSFDNSGYTYLPVLIVPQRYLNSGDYVIEFTFNNQTINSSYAIPTDHLSKYVVQTDGGAEEAIYAFVQGKVYTYEFDFNNYAQVMNVNVNVSDEWPSETFRMEF